MTKQQIQEDLENTLKNYPKRLSHVYGMRDTALRLGEKYNLDLEVLEIAALLHDITKYYSKDDNKEIIKSYFPESKFIFDEYNDNILHAFSGYILAKKKYGIKNGEILNSILNHTVGRPNMSMYEKVIFISDYIEPTRTYESCVKVRNIVEDSLDLAVYTAINDSIIFHEKKNIKIPLIAFEARHYYRNILEDKDD
ncbi:MAG: bis(5'-nucleosyl)-tetraphosphatase (symmetrical) YqeK [Candidatus Izimaplasma sp.]|nr:bis(5'-nucleosyl)-tetraphosphatase (symmetrical) YqeK [Candidatus Izimaplasma bacterium]